MPTGEEMDVHTFTGVRSPQGVMAKVLNCGTKISEFELEPSRT